MVMDALIKTSECEPGLVMKERPKLVLQKTSLASLECLAMPLVHKVVLSADFQCPKCRERINDIISRMNEIESVVLNVLDKTVTLTCIYPLMKKLPARQVGNICYKPPQGILELLLRLCRLSKR